MDPVRVLVVDDEPDIREILDRALSLAGYTVALAHDGKSAVAQCRMFMPHIILLDVMMPDMSGIEALQKIREFDQDAKIVMVSGMHDLQVAKDAIACGAVDYITKPFDLREMDHYIKGLISSSL